MNIEKILVAYDGSKESEKAFDMALDLAGKYSAQVLVVSVACPSEPPTGVEMDAILEVAKEYFHPRFSDLREKASRCGVEPQFKISTGHPAQEIVSFANEEKAQMIVMGHRGRGSFLHLWRLGSVARRVINYAHCTVVVVR
jgi:nucleotide-binding universal stress UspA family protein